MAVGTGPAGVTELLAHRVAVVVTEAIVTWSTELSTSRTMEVRVTDGAIAVPDGREKL